MSEVVGHANRKLIRKEFNAEALFIAEFTEPQIATLGTFPRLAVIGCINC